MRAVFLLALVGLHCSEASSDHQTLKLLWSASRVNGSGAFPVGLGAQAVYLNEPTYEALPKGILTSYDMATGAVRWRITLPDTMASCSRPLETRGVTVCPGVRQILGLDASNGAVRWKVATAAPAVYPYSTAHEGVFYIGASDYIPGLPTTVTALEATSGNVLWRRDIGSNWPYGGHIAGILWHDATLYVTADRPHQSNGYLRSTVVVALDAATGAEKWRFQDGAGQDDRMAIGPPVIEGTRLFYISNDAIAIDVVTRQKLWTLQQRPGYVGPGWSPSVRAGVVYVAGGDGWLRAVEATTGQLRWESNPDEGSYFHHGLCGGLFLADNNALTVVESASGTRRGLMFDGSESVDTGADFAVRENRLFIVTTDHIKSLECTT